jgi:hypothetical protein
MGFSLFASLGNQADRRCLPRRRRGPRRFFDALGTRADAKPVALTELEINPLIASASGIIAVDARASLAATT